MTEDQYRTLLLEISMLKERLLRLEARAPGIAGDETPPPFVSYAEQFSLPTTETPKKPSNALGYLGAACVVFAMVLLIKFTIDSGWLTPIRQMVFATLFGATLALSPLLSKLEDRAYAAIIPAVGIVTLNLVVYGCVFYHQLFTPQYGLGLVSVVGALALWMLRAFKEETFGFLAVAGTFVGAIALRSGFSSLAVVAVYLIAWHVIFSLTAIGLRIRSVLAFSCFIALLTVALLSLKGGQDLIWPVVKLQIGVAALTAIALAAYSIVHQTALTARETQQFFPVFLFFYCHVFYLLDMVNPHYATGFAVAFALSVLALLLFTKTRLDGAPTPSTPIIYTFVTVVLCHSLFFVSMNDLARYTTVALLLLAARTFSTELAAPQYRGMKIILGLVVAYGLLDMTLSPGQMSFWVLTFFGFFYGAMALSLLGSGDTDSSYSKELLLLAAHSQMLLAIHRLEAVIGASGVPPLWTAYAFFVLYLGVKRQDATIGKSSFPVIVFAIAYFLLRTFGQLGQTHRISSLLVMGTLIYASGYLYRKIRPPGVESGAH